MSKLIIIKTLVLIFTFFPLFSFSHSYITSELSHELPPINLNTNSTGIDLILFKDLFEKNQITFCLGIGYFKHSSQI